MLDSEHHEPILKQGTVLQGRFRVGDLLGEGSFGSVFKIYDMFNNNEVLAMKVEQDVEDEESMLDREIKVILELKKKTGFPQIKYHGSEQCFQYYIMNMLGPNLEVTNKKCGGSFSIVTILKIGLQMLNRIETFHTQRLIHRDIKPDNFVLGVSQQQNIIHLIDFGLSKFYINTKGEHIKQVRKKGLIGTARYASINAHNEIEQSRRDDLESIAYILVYLATGTLPWMNLQIEHKDLKYAKILYLKKNTKPEVVCKDLPQCFSKFLTFVKNLEFTQTPDYSTYKKLFQGELENHPVQTYYDWEIVGDTQTKKKSNTMHILPQEPIKQQNNINNLHISIGNTSNKNTLHFGQQQQQQDTILEEGGDKKLNMQISGKVMEQFEKFDQIIQQKKYSKMTSSKRQSNGKHKKPQMISVIDEEEHLQQQAVEYHQYFEEEQAQGIKSLRYLQPPHTPKIQYQSLLQPQYIPSLNTSQVNNYDWSDVEEINSEGKPLCSMYIESEIVSPSKFNVTKNKDFTQKEIICKDKQKQHQFKRNSFSALQYPKQNSVKGSDEEVCDID